MHFPDKRRTGQSKQKVKHLWERQHRILRLCHQGFSNVEVAAMVGVTPQNVSDIKNSQLGQQKLNVMKANSDLDALEGKDRIDAMVTPSMKFLEDIILAQGEAEGASLALRAKYADKHLSRAGFGEIRKVAQMSGKLSSADIMQIKERADAEKAAQARIINVTPNGNGTTHE